MQREVLPTATAPRTHTWLPDSRLDAHPFGSWLLAMGFDIWIRAFYRRTVVKPAHFCLQPGTLIASNHQRDVDGPMLGTLLARRRGLHFQSPPFFAAREDLFRPGILARLTVRWPDPLPALLGRISLAWFFPLGRAEPMRRVREFTLGETLLALQRAGCGAQSCAALLNARGLRELALTDDHVALDAAVARCDLETLEHWWGLRRLRLVAIKQVTPAFRMAVTAQLAHFAQRLERGCCVYFSPEGTIAADGHFGRVRAGYFRLCRSTSTPPWIQPMALAYDSLAAGRARAVVRVGECFRANPTLERHAFDAQLRHAVVSLAPITASHLLARFLLHGPARFIAAELAAWLAHCIATLRARNAPLDPLIAHASMRQLANRRLRWLRRKRLVVCSHDEWRNTCPHDVEAGWDTPAQIVRYLDNHLADLVPDVDRTLPC